MAGRCISVTHEALGTVRVMKTCGMMGEVVGKAASLCVQFDCAPRDIYAQHLAELKQLCRLPGKSRRATVDEPAGDPGRCSGRSSGRTAHGPATVKRIRSQGRQTLGILRKHPISGEIGYLRNTAKGPNL